MNGFSVKNFYHLITVTNDVVTDKNNIIVSFDVESFFTFVLVEKAVDLTLNMFTSDNALLAHTFRNIFDIKTSNAFSFHNIFTYAKFYSLMGTYNCPILMKHNKNYSYSTCRFLLTNQYLSSVCRRHILHINKRTLNRISSTYQFSLQPHNVYCGKGARLFFGLL